MELQQSEEGRVTVVTVTGNLVIGEAESQFKKAISRLLEEGKSQILIDCSGLGVVDSTGLGALVRALQTSQNEGGQTKLLRVGPHLRKLLEMTKLDAVFESFESRGEAVSSFS